MKPLAILAGIALTVLCWGAYGPVLHQGQHGLDSSRLKPLICVGIAYFVVAIIVPTVLLTKQGQLRGGWSLSGTSWSLLAGTAGALGALGIIIALSSGGSPVYVMPLVFGCAPVVNVAIAVLMSRGSERPSSLFYSGLILVAIGAAVVFVFKPGHHSDKTTDTPAPSVTATELESPQGEAAVPGPVAIMVGIVLTVFCWGSYGPALHKGQAGLANSRLKPLICVGLAYFLVAIIVPSGWLASMGALGTNWHWDGISWSLVAGTAGALGALGIIIALSSGGRPVYVMPIVFGCAPVINVLISVLKSSGVEPPHPIFYSGLTLVAVGAVVVLVFQPRIKKPGQGSPTKELSTPKNQSTTSTPDKSASTDESTDVS